MTKASSPLATKTYRVSITETVYYSIFVQASDEEAARESAWEQNAFWDRNDECAEVTEIVECD